MSSVTTDDSEQKTLQLLADLPRVDATFGDTLYLYQGVWLFRDAVLGAMQIQNHFNHHPTDIFLTSFMKSGTTWLRSLMFTILNRSRFDFSDHPLLRKGPHDCFPVLDTCKPEDYAVTDNSPRLFATHFPHKMLPSSITDPSSGCKFVYVCRDPKDVLVSMWHFVDKLRPKELPPLSFDEVFNLFCEGVMIYGPYWDHVLGFWNAALQSPEKILFFKYEEMKKDPEGHVKKLAKFMGVPISGQEEEDGMVKKIVEFCSIEHLTSLEVNKNGVYKANTGYIVPNETFFRKGEVGDWKCHLTEAMKDQIDRITHDKLKGSGLTIGATNEGHPMT
ncbi:hypothetical protein L1987_82704 [Smallanthus sonchifolius]|uniref:Uncharacterized protein n=1 Tax=Smallanthus sonchifolius TaxID=185202 RepID=A0ACB8YC36_9ASTR|nr:hypothetical protein L1987_82704 [Smallanthus sonchifolius]